MTNKIFDPFDIKNAPIGEPEGLLLSTSAIWRKQLNFAPTAVSLSYNFEYFSPSSEGVNQSIPMIHISTGMWAVNVGSDHFTDWRSGDFIWDLVASQVGGSKTIVVESGRINLFSSSDDRRSHAETMLQKIESILEKRSDSDVSSYSIKGRSIDKMSVADLMMWRNYYRQELDGASASSALGAPVKKANPNKVQVRF